MSTNEFVELQIVILAASCVLMLAVLFVESGGTMMRLIIFAAALINAVAALVFIAKERKRLRNRDVTHSRTS